MYISETKLRIRYAETDQMGYVYYGNYAQFFEVGRVEALRQLGLNYKEVEESGLIMPVLTFNIKFNKPAYYDDLITIRTTIKHIPSMRIHFDYETFNETGILLNTGSTTLVFLDKKTTKPVLPPFDLIEKLKRFF
jgi:acyl-CoA thioester hydrolase